MSDPPDTPGAEVAGTAAPPSDKPPMSHDRQIAIASAVLLLLVIALVATGPFWAPSLPWSTSSDAALAGRFDRLDQAQQHVVQEAAATTAGLQRLDRRLTALEAKPGIAASDLSELRQQITKLNDTTNDLTRRIDALDKRENSQTAAEAADLAMALALLQIRDAVELGRPFAAAYGTLMTVARGRPDIASAAAPLAEPANSGVASRAVLASRLREVGSTIAAVPADRAEDWTDQALARLKGLVTIRRIDDAGTAPADSPVAAVSTAQRALAGGNLDAAVAALDKLDGSAAEAARPWLGMAKQRLAVETALRHLDALLAVHLGGGAAGASPAAGSSR